MLFILKKFIYVIIIVIVGKKRNCARAQTFFGDDLIDICYTRVRIHIAEEPLAVRRRALLIISKAELSITVIRI